MSASARSLTLTILAVALILPYAVTQHTYPIPTFYSEFTALALYLALGAAVALGTGLERSPGWLDAPTALLAPLGFGAVLLAQTVLLPLLVPSMNWLALGYLLASVVAMQAGYAFAKAEMAEAVTHLMAGALIIGGLFAVFCQVVQLSHHESTFYPFVIEYGVTDERRPYGNMAQANHLATYMAFGLMSALYLARIRRLPVWAWVVLSAVLSAGLAFTVSRGPWLQVMVMVVAGLWMIRSHGAETEPNSRARAWGLPLGLAAVFVAVNVAVRWANVHFQLGLAESAAERMQEAGQIAPRLALWKYGLTMFRMHPVLGVGWGEFPTYQLALARALGGVEIANNSHDIFIDLLAKSGLIGLGVLLLTLGLWFVRALRAPHATYRIYGFALLGIVLMHALVEYPQQYMFFLLPVMFVIGLLETRPLRLLSGGVAFGFLATLSLGGLLALYPVFSDYRRAEVLYYGAHPALQYREHPSTLFGAWGDYGAATLLPISSFDLQDKLAAHQRALALLPGEVVLRRYAVLQALDGQEDEAFDTVARLQIFAKELDDWPDQLSGLYSMLDTQPRLKDFKRKLVAEYGTPVEDDTGDDGN
jgi:O-antigen ligase